MNECAVRERPILFSGPMVRAILDGCKTQTRRPARFDGPFDYPALDGAKCVNIGRKTYWLNSQADHPQHVTKACRYGQLGDRLWVRETWQPYVLHGEDAPQDLTARGNWKVNYPATDDLLEFYDEERSSLSTACRPSIFMPRWASRLMLEITEVRVERLRDISEADAIAEGLTRRVDPKTLELHGGPMYRASAEGDAVERWTSDPREAFRAAWSRIHGPTIVDRETLERLPNPSRWDANPWVWALTFRRVNAEKEVERG